MIDWATFLENYVCQTSVTNSGKKKWAPSLTLVDTILLNEVLIWQQFWAFQEKYMHLSFQKFTTLLFS